MIIAFRQLGAQVLIVTTCLLAGCVLGDRQPTLHYPPKAETGAVPVAQAAVKPAPKSVQIVVMPFVDQRSDKKVVGTTRNAFGMRMADVIPTNSVPDWVTQAIKMELQNSGYLLLSAGAADEAAAGTAVVLSGEVLNVFCDMYLSYTGQVSLLTRLSRGGKEVLNRHYAGEGSAGLAWAATEESYAQSLALALASAIRQFLADLENSLKAP